SEYIMVARSSRATSGTTRRRRVKDEKQETAEVTSMDDASDVIFDESDEGKGEDKPKPRRRKKSTRRRKKADEEVAVERSEVSEDSQASTAASAESKDDRGDEPRGQAEDRGQEEGRGQAEGRGQEEGRGQSAAQTGPGRRRESSAEGDEDQGNRPRRRRRGRRGRRTNNDNSSDNETGSRRRGRRGGMNRSTNESPRRVRSVAPSTEVVEGTIEGVLELHPKNYGFLRAPEKNYIAQESDPFVPSSLVEKAGLREGVLIKGEVGPGVRNQGPRLHEIETVDGLSVEEYAEVKNFEDLIPVTPHKRIDLETGPRPVTMRVMDLLTPIGKGQRALIVAPPRTGKTMLLQDIANAVSKNHPEIHLMVLLIDERPEEVTEMRRNIDGEVIASSMDRDVESHVRMSQLMIERAKRMAESGKDVFVLMDSITRMARAFNKWCGGGRDRGAGTMSGGLHIKALDIPKKLFGTARQFEDGGSLTIAATALIDTGGRMDEVIFQEFKGTGNMELYLSRDLADRRIWPAIDITRSGTRHEEKLFAEDALDSVIMLRRSLISLSPVEAMEQLTRTLDRFPTNTEFLQKVKAIL
ncbi:MAG: transcription termination factor Rho, partial [Planctomycetaceae bacterium]